MSSDEATPDGEQVETYTLWLTFPDEGECAISIDATRAQAGLRKLADALKARDVAGVPVDSKAKETPK